MTLNGQATDKLLYKDQYNTFSSQELPHDEMSWLERAAVVSKILADDVTIRDIEQKIPVAEISLLKASGLTKLLGPRKYGGGGQSWDVAYKTIREVAKGDG